VGEPAPLVAKSGAPASPAGALDGGAADHVRASDEHQAWLRQSAFANATVLLGEHCRRDR